MRNVANLFLLAAVLSLALNGCGASPSSFATPSSLPSISAPPTLTPALFTPTPTPIPRGKTIVVTSAEDSGTGTLRQALQEARPGDTITFDPEVFPPTKPTTISLTSLLPEITQGYLTIDASNAGVILDGSKIVVDWGSAFKITSTGNTIQGLQIMNFTSGEGFEISSGAQHNLIGGDPASGSGPTGQGNLVGNCVGGISIGGEQTSFNTISGNFIGTNRNGDMISGLSSGIWIEDGANHNTIGPGNIIAYASSDGIVILDTNTVGNTITQNSIFRNPDVGIRLSYGIRSAGNKQVDPPIITDFNLQDGLVQGVTCPGCKVEIFSDSGNQGEVYEGNTTADINGTFIFNMSDPLTGPHLTATVTDVEGNTSAFSAYTFGLAKFITILQEGNDLPKTRIVTKESQKLEDNHIGGDIGNWIWKKGEDNSVVYNNLLQSINDLGLKWVRTNFWSPDPMYSPLHPLNWQEVLRAPGVYSIPPDCDDFITDLASDGVNIVLTLSAGAGLDGPQYGCWGGPGWGVLGDREPEWWFKTQKDSDRFIEYARFMVQHFKGRVKYYEIWNEPNAGENPGDCRGGVNVNDYVTLVKQVAPVIRQIDPEAKIVAGAVGPFQEYSRQWLRTMFDSGVAPFVDAVSWHAFSGDSPLTDSGEYPRNQEAFYWRDYPATVESLWDYATARGFSGQFMVEETNWRTANDYVPTEDPFYTDIEAAKYAARVNIIHLGLDFTMHSNQMLMPDVIKLLPRYYVIRNISTVMAGAKPTSFPIRVQGKATNIKSYAFLLLNDDRLIALWTDGVAVDDDPGISLTLTLPGFVGWKATGIDVLNGFEQELMTSKENGNLIVHNFLIKDYPIIIRLSK